MEKESKSDTNSIQKRRVRKGEQEYIGVCVCCKTESVLVRPCCASDDPLAFCSTKCFDNFFDNVDNGVCEPTHKHVFNAEWYVCLWSGWSGVCSVFSVCAMCVVCVCAYVCVLCVVGALCVCV